VTICNRTAAGQPDVESLCPLWAPFRPSDDDGSRNPTSAGGQGGSRSERSVWVVTSVAVKMVSTKEEIIIYVYNLLYTTYILLINYTILYNICIEDGYVEEGWCSDN
jgi:hypothetical protein